MAKARVSRAPALSTPPSSNSSPPTTPTSSHSNQSPIPNTTNSRKRKRNNTTNGTSNPPRSAGPQSRLTEKQKKENHVNAEKERRKEILDRMTVICDELVPGARGLAKSDEAALKLTSEHIRVTLLRKKELSNKIIAQGGKVPEQELLYVSMLDNLLDQSDSEEDDEPHKPQRQRDDEYEDDDDGDDSNENEEDEEDDISNGNVDLSIDHGAEVALFNMANGH